MGTYVVIDTNSSLLGSIGGISDTGIGNNPIYHCTFHQKENYLVALILLCSLVGTLGSP